MPVMLPVLDQQGQFRWIEPLECIDRRLEGAVWDCDGSMLNGKWKAFTVAGFGIAVVPQIGDLLPYELGWAPSWCSTAAAEVWAVQVILTQCPFPPQMRTDCMAIIATALAGTTVATHHP